MITLARQIDLKLKKFDEVMIKLKTKYLEYLRDYNLVQVILDYKIGN